MSKDNKFIKKMRNTLLFVLAIIILYFFMKIINEDILKHYQFWYCPGDRYFVGDYKTKSLGCFAILEHLRLPSLYIVVGIAGIIGLICDFATKKN